MKLIMENWKRFLSENKKEDIRNLKYGELKKRKHKRELSQELKVIDIKLSDIPIAKFPANDSEAARNELKKVLDTMTNNREILLIGNFDHDNKTKPYLEEAIPSSGMQRSNL